MFVFYWNRYRAAERIHIDLAALACAKSLWLRPPGDFLSKKLPKILNFLFL